MKAFLPVKDFVPDQFIVMVTKQGVIKKSELTEFDNPMSRGIIAVTLDEGDELIARPASPTARTTFSWARTKGRPSASRRARCAPMGRPARGVRAMDLAEGDYLVGMEVVGEGGPHSFDRRERLRQAHAARGLPPDRARRQGRHQHEDHHEDRQGGGDPFGEGRFRPDDRQPERQDHPHRVFHHPPGGPLHAGRPAGVAGRRRQSGRRFGDPRYRSENGNGQETLPLQ